MTTITNINCKHYNTAIDAAANYGACLYKNRKKFWVFKPQCILLQPNSICEFQEIYPKPSISPGPRKISNRSNKKGDIIITKELLDDGVVVKDFISNISIDQITTIRAKNNLNWMNILKLAFKYAPDEAKKIMKDVADCDHKINKLTKELCK